MKKLQIILILFVFYSIKTYAQTDTSYSYVYECDGCGRFETISSEPIELETEVTVTTTTLAYAGTSTLAAFSNVDARKSKNKNEEVSKHNLFNVYPNPSSGAYFLNFESAANCNAQVLCYNMFGVELSKKIVTIKKGMNVIEENNKDLPNGNYFVKALFNDKWFVKKLTINKKTPR